MAVTVGNITASSGGVASTGVTFAHDNNGDMLIVGAGERGTPSGVTYNGVAMTALGAFNNGVSNNGNMYYLSAPTSGSNNVVESHSIGYSTVGATSLIGASDTIGTYGTGSGTSTTPSKAISSAVTSIVVDHCIHNQGAILTATGTGQTRRYNLEQANAVAGSTTTGAATTTVSYSCVGSNVWSIGCVSVDQLVGYAMTADQGAYTYTGQAANLLVGRLIDAAQGAYTYTGQTANVLYGRVLVAIQGAYTLTGQNIITTVFRQLKEIYVLSVNLSKHMLGTDSHTRNVLNLDNSKEIKKEG